MKNIVFILLSFLILLITFDLAFPEKEYRTEKLNSITEYHTGEVSSNFDTFSVDYQVDVTIGERVVVVEHRYKIFKFLDKKVIHPNFKKT